VKLALQDVGLAVMNHLGFIEEARRGAPRQRHGNELFGAFGRDFRTADGQRVMVVGLTGNQWKSLCEALAMQPEVDALAARLGLDLGEEGNRFRARRELEAIVSPRIAARTLAELARCSTGCGCAGTATRASPSWCADDPECSPANPMFSTITQPGVGEMLAAGLPLDFSARQRVPAAPAPRLGEHTGQVLHDLLGLSQAEFGQLVERRVVAAAS
jgi:2-methylfumaryl-CoA isomerase